VTVGHDSKIGACSVVVQDVPPHSTVVGVPGKIAAHPKNVVGEHYDLEHGALPDPEWNAITSLRDELQQVEQKLTKIMKERPTDYEI
jgi:serine O-acetyltransferase